MNYLLRLEKILFCIFLFLIPFQIRTFIPPAGGWAGNEWNSIFIYLGDILFVGVIGLWLVRLIKQKSPMGLIRPIGLIGLIGL